MKNNYKMRDNIYPIITVLLAIFLWQAIVNLFHIPGYILPSPYNVGKALLNDYSLIIEHAKVTIYESMVGLAISILLAFLLSIIMDNFVTIKKSIYPIIIISQTIPTMAIAPLLIIWFGFGVLPKVVVIVLTCFFPICISLVEGFSQVDQEYLNLFKATHATKWQTYYHLKFPYVMPNFFSGLKISTTYMVMAAIIGEWLGGDKGIGVYMVRAQHAYAINKVFASIIVIIVLSIIAIYIIDVIKKKVIHWTK